MDPVLLPELLGTCRPCRDAPAQGPPLKIGTGAALLKFTETADRAKQNGKTKRYVSSKRI